MGLRVFTFFIFVFSGYIPPTINLVDFNV